MENPLLQQTNQVQDVQPTLEACEESLRRLGLSDEQISELGATIDVIGDTIFDRYFAEFYD
jgi:alkylhydroperoxidase family enzyme